jgi:hypothetical protein
VNQQLYCRCGCRDETGRQYGKDCPKLKSDPKHGSWGYYLSHGSEPEIGQRRQFRKADRGPRLHHGGRPGTRSRVHHATVPEPPQRTW